MASESVGGVMVITLYLNERDVDLKIALGVISPIFIAHMALDHEQTIYCLLVKTNLHMYI